MRGDLSHYSLSWAIGILSSNTFRLVLLIILLFAFVRLLFGYISGMRFIKIFISLLLIALVPQLLYFFHGLFGGK